MGSSDGCREVSANAPTNALEGLEKTSGRSFDGGGYGPQVRRISEQNGLGWGQDHHRSDPIAEPAGGADEAFWARGVHAGE